MRQSLRRSGAALQRVSTALLLISLAGALSVGRAEIVRAPQASRTTVTPRKDPTQPAFAFNLQAGPHLDFRLTYGPDQERIDREVRRLAASSRNDEILEAAVVANPLRRPMLYADIDDLDQEETVPDDWFNDVNNQRGTIARSLRSVGRIEVEHLVSDPSVVCSGMLSRRTLISPSFRYVWRKQCSSVHGFCM